MHNLPVYQHRKVFELLCYGLNVCNDPFVINTTLEFIETKQIHSKLPILMDFSSLLQEFPRNFQFYQEVWIMGSFLQNPDVKNVKIFKLPLAILKARAPGILRLLPSSEPHGIPVYSLPFKIEVLEAAVQFMMNHKPLDINSIEYLSELYSLANMLGMAALKKACLIRLETIWPDLEELEFAVNMFAHSSGDDKEQLKSYLLFHIFRFLPDEESSIKTIIDVMRSTDKDCFKKIDLYSIYDRMSFPPGFDGLSRPHPHVDLRDIKLLSRLFPELVSLDLKEAVLHENVLKEIAQGLRNLEHLSVDCSSRSVINNVQHLR